MKSVSEFAVGNIRKNLKKRESIIDIKSILDQGNFRHTWLKSYTRNQKHLAFILTHATCLMDHHKQAMSLIGTMGITVA